MMPLRLRVFADRPVRAEDFAETVAAVTMSRDRLRTLACRPHEARFPCWMAMPDNCHVRKWLFLLGAIIAEVTGTLALKGALDSPALYFIVGFGYAAAFVFLSFTLRVGMPLGIAYGIWGAAGVALTAVLSLLFFAEPLTPVMITGIVFIMAGVILVEVGNRDDDAHQTVAEEPPHEPGDQS